MVCEITPVSKKFISSALEAEAVRFVRNSQNLLHVGQVSGVKRKLILNQYLTLRSVAEEFGLKFNMMVVVANPQFWDTLKTVLGVFAEE